MGLELDFTEVRKQFPALNQKVRGKDLVYLDSAATSLKPQSVIDRIQRYYTMETANVHRGAHFLADQGTTYFEGVRRQVSTFINAAQAEEIVFTRGTTESINLVASSFGGKLIRAGDVILLTEMEHHANIVPWQILAEQKGASIHWVNVTDAGELDLVDLENKILNLKPKIFAFTACSNTLGTMNPVEQIVQIAKKSGVVTLVDAAQFVAQQEIDVQTWGADFLVFSGHKIFGPTGIGVLYGKADHLNWMPPYQGGGSMISTVSFEGTTFNEIPFKFEAGTPHIEGVIGLGTALEFVSKIGFERIMKWEHELLSYAQTQLEEVSGIQFLGKPGQKAPIISFNIDGLHPSDIGQILDQQGVAVRVGHHCTQPLLKKFGLSGTVRASFSIYNNFSDVDSLVRATLKARELLS